MPEIRARFQHAYLGFTLDVDLTLPGRGVTALFGPSGSGKTTLLRCIAGLERAGVGQLSVDGSVWQDDSACLPTHQRPIGYVFQEASLFAHLSVQGNLDYGMQRSQRRTRYGAIHTPCGALRPASPEKGISSGHADFLHIVELLGIGALLDRQPDRLSGGERQRVAIARALLTRPRLLLMDEPLAALDLARKNEILPYLERLHDELEIPVLYVSHAPDEVARLADHIVVMETGRAIAQGPLVEVLSRIDLPIRLGEDTGVVLDGQVIERDENWHLARIGFAGGSVWVRDGGHPLGYHIRVRILARDVSIARAAVLATSIINTLPAEVVALGDDTHPALLLVRLQVGASAVIARITRRSACGLDLKPGQTVWVQIKAVALIG